MRRSHAYVILALLVVLAPAGSLRVSAQGAPTPDALQAANELMAVMSKETVRQMVAGVTSQVWPSIERAIRNKRGNIEQTALSELRAEFESIQMQYMVSVMADAPPIYARHFTAQELRDMIAFHRTPTGQKSMQLMPQVMSEVFAMVAPKMQGLQAQVMDAFTRALRQRGIDL
jgi:uncharacterized protein